MKVSSKRVLIACLMIILVYAAVVVIAWLYNPPKNTTSTLVEALVGFGAVAISAAVWYTSTKQTNEQIDLDVRDKTPFFQLEIETTTKEGSWQIENRIETVKKEIKNSNDDDPEPKVVYKFRFKNISESAIQKILILPDVAETVDSYEQAKEWGELFRIIKEKINKMKEVMDKKGVDILKLCVSEETKKIRKVPGFMKELWHLFASLYNYKFDEKEEEEIKKKFILGEENAIEQIIKKIESIPDECEGNCYKCDCAECNCEMEYGVDFKELYNCWSLESEILQVIDPVMNQIFNQNEFTIFYPLLPDYDDSKSHTRKIGFSFVITTVYDYKYLQRADFKLEDIMEEENNKKYNYSVIRDYVPSVVQLKNKKSIKSGINL